MSAPANTIIGIFVQHLIYTATDIPAVIVAKVICRHIYLHNVLGYFGMTLLVWGEKPYVKKKEVSEHDPVYCLRERPLGVNESVPQRIKPSSRYRDEGLIF